MALTDRMRIMSFDPGGSTGIAYLQDREVIGREQLSGDHHERLYGRMVSFRPEVVVYEEFDYRPHQDHAELVSKEYIGIIKLFCMEREIPYVGQLATIGKVTNKTVFWDSYKIKRLGLWAPNMPHAMDATGHLLYYWTFVLKQKDFLNQLKDLGDFV